MKLAFASSDAQSIKRYSELFYRQSILDCPFTVLEGRGGLGKNGEIMDAKQYFNPTEDDVDGDAMITVIRNMEKNTGGAEVQVPMFNKLDPKKEIREGETILGNEQALTTDYLSLTLEWRALASSVKNRMEPYRTKYSMSLSETSKKSLQTCYVENRMIKYTTALTESPTVFVFHTETKPIARSATLAVAKTALTAAYGKLTASFLSMLSTAAQTGFDVYNASTQVTYKIRKCKLGKNLYGYVLVIHPDAVTDINVDPVLMQAQREAEARAKDNPIFKLGCIFYKDILVVPSETMPIGTNAGESSKIPWAQGALCGAQALLKAEGGTPEIVNELTDYQTVIGNAIKFVQKTKTPTFTTSGLTMGSMAVVVARTQCSDISVST